MKQNKHLIAALCGLLALCWATYGLALSCVAPDGETVTLQLDSLTSDDVAGDASPYQGVSASLTVINLGADVNLRLTKGSDPAIVEQYNAAR